MTGPEHDSAVTSCHQWPTASTLMSFPLALWVMESISHLGHYSLVDKDSIRWRDHCDKRSKFTGQNNEQGQRGAIVQSKVSRKYWFLMNRRTRHCACQRRSTPSPSVPTSSALIWLHVVTKGCPVEAGASNKHALQRASGGTVLDGTATSQEHPSPTWMGGRHPPYVRDLLHTLTRSSKVAVYIRQASKIAWIGEVMVMQFSLLVSQNGILNRVISPHRQTLELWICDILMHRKSNVIKNCGLMW